MDATAAEGDVKISLPFNFVSRDEWRAVAPWSILEEIHPVPCVALFTTTDSEFCFTKEECMEAVLCMQNKSMFADGETDIPYNFLIGDDGNVYEGRGWNRLSSKRLKASAKYPHRYDIGYLGAYDNKKQPKHMFELTKQLLRYGKENKFLTNDFMLIDVSDDTAIFAYEEDI